jgi:hypothetical protein
MRLSGPQKRLLGRMMDAGAYDGDGAKPLEVSGNELRTARSLERKGLARVLETFGGSMRLGVHWSGHGARITREGARAYKRAMWP